MKTNTSMTIYNRYLDIITGTDRWQRHLVHEVFWDSVRGVKFEHGLINSGKCTVYIPYSDNYMSDYLNPIEFRDDPVGHWTLQSGDIMVKGTVTDEINKQSDLERKYSDVCVVTSVSLNAYGGSNMHHFRVGGG